MKTANRSAPLMTELMIVVIFFLLVSTVLLQVFAAARSRSTDAQRITAAVSEAQNVAERLYTAGEAEQVLAELGFVHDGTDWSRDDGTYRLTVHLDETGEAAGVMREGTVRATDPEGNTLLTLPCSRWMGGAA